jgi:hypothetical protein
MNASTSKRTKDQLFTMGLKIKKMNKLMWILALLLEVYMIFINKNRGKNMMFKIVNSLRNSFKDNLTNVDF